MGLAVGCLTDLINFALHPTGMFFPGFTLTQGMTAALPGLFTLHRDPLTWRKLDPEWSPHLNQPGEEERPLGATVWAYLRLLGIFAVTKLITSVLMVSYFSHKVTLGTPLLYEISHRAVVQAWHVPIYTFLSLAVLQGLAQTDLYARLLKARR
jgi:hypothetical protein